MNISDTLVFVAFGIMFGIGIGLMLSNLETRRVERLKKELGIED